MLTTPRPDAERKREMKIYECLQCGESTEIWCEGVCGLCWIANQDSLDLHNSTFTEWERLTDDEREKRIKDAT